MTVDCPIFLCEKMWFPAKHLRKSATKNTVLIRLFRKYTADTFAMLKYQSTEQNDFDLYTFWY